MAKNYLTYPTKNMRITQNYNGTVSHKPNSTGTPKDYPWDEGCSGTGRDWMYCPCDKMKIMRIYGVNGPGTNTIWLQSTSKVVFADGTSDYAVLLVTHPDDDDLSKLKVGQTFKRGEKICREGKDDATGYHFHYSAGKGKYKASGWAQNSKNAWVLTLAGKTYKPEELFYIDPKFTKVLGAAGLKFKELPPTYTTGTYKVTTDVLNVRSGAGTSYAKKTYSKLTANARKQILDIAGKKVDGYVEGMLCSVSKISGNWGKTPSGWICLDYCKKVK